MIAQSFLLLTAALMATAAAVPLDARTTSKVQVVGYLGNACNGEELDGTNDLVVNKCYDISEYEEASSFTVAGFKKHQTVHFYYNSDCTDQTGTANSEECYLVGSDIKSYKLTG